MRFDKSMLRLYAVTDRNWLSQAADDPLAAKALAAQLKEALLGGITCIQLREKNINDEEFLAIAKKVQTVANRFRIPFFINDNIDVAVSCNADGVHVGQSDMEAGDVRKKIGKDVILGVSVQTKEQAVIAEKQGADYLGVGAMFSTARKNDADSVSISELQEICDSVSIPVVAIGGISCENLSLLYGSGIAGIAVISAIFGQKDIKAATEQLRLLADKF